MGACVHNRFSSPKQRRGRSAALSQTPAIASPHALGLTCCRSSKARSGAGPTHPVRWPVCPPRTHAEWGVPVSPSARARGMSVCTRFTRLGNLRCRSGHRLSDPCLFDGSAPSVRTRTIDSGTMPDEGPAVVVHECAGSQVGRGLTKNLQEVSPQPVGSRCSYEDVSRGTVGFSSERPWKCQISVDIVGSWVMGHGFTGWMRDDTTRS